MLARLPRSLVVAASAAAAWLCSGCGSDPQCVIDTDCDALQVCNAANECVPRGGGGEMDASLDAGMRDAGGGSDGGGGMDASTGDAGMDGGGLLGTGTLQATSNQDLRTDAGGVASSYTVSASFAYASEGDDGCTTETLGPCTVTECTPPPAMDAGTADGGTDAGATDAGTPPPPATAGDIQVTGGTIDPVTLSPSSGVYPAQTGTQALWTAAGTTLMAQAGHRPFMEEPVPEFMTNVQTPVAVTIEMPAFGLDMSIPRTVPLDVQWSGTSSVGSLVMRLSGPGTGGVGSSTSAKCTFAVDSEDVTSGTVPMSVLQRFGAGTGTLTFTIENQTTMDVEGWRITFNAATSAKKASPAGGKASASVPIE